jgi:hypothetical protein
LERGGQSLKNYLHRRKAPSVAQDAIEALQGQCSQAGVQRIHIKPVFALAYVLWTGRYDLSIFLVRTNYYQLY